MTHLKSKDIQRLNTAVECFTRNLRADQIKRLHQAMMYKGKELDLLTKIVNGEVK